MSKTLERTITESEIDTFISMMDMGLGEPQCQAKHMRVNGLGRDIGPMGPCSHIATYIFPVGQGNRRGYSFLVCDAFQAQADKSWRDRLIPL